MSTHTLKLHRPWLQRAVETLREAFVDWREQRTARRAIEAALQLDEATLRDIGAPLWLLEEARQRREQARFERDLKHVRQDAGAHHFV